MKCQYKRSNRRQQRAELQKSWRVLFPVSIDIDGTKVLPRPRGHFSTGRVMEFWDQEEGKVKTRQFPGNVYIILSYTKDGKPYGPMLRRAT